MLQFCLEKKKWGGKVMKLKRGEMSGKVCVGAKNSR